MFVFPLLLLPSLISLLALGSWLQSIPLPECSLTLTTNCLSSKEFANSTFRSLNPDLQEFLNFQSNYIHYSVVLSGSTETQEEENELARIISHTIEFAEEWDIQDRLRIRNSGHD
jgi:hypothetical protein